MAILGRGFQNRTFFEILNFPGLSLPLSKIQITARPLNESI